MTTTPHLPHDWQPNEALKHLLPPGVDYRTFKPARLNPRYLVCIVGTGVFDTQRGVFCENRPSKPDSPRRRYGLVPGPNAKEVRIPYARLICEAAYGPAPGPTYEAHHPWDNPDSHHWADLAWQTKPQNLALQRRTQKRRARADDKRHKLTHDQLATFVSLHDEDRRNNRTPNLKRYATRFNVHVRQLQRIIAGDTRADEVKEIRRKLAAESYARARNRHSMERLAELTGSASNPFLDTE